MQQDKSSILIVDDDKSSIDVLVHILRNEYAIHVAKNAQAALKCAVNDNPDIILLDVLMPEISGFDLIKKLKENEKTLSIPVIFITGLANAADEERGFLLGAVDYITKPFNNSIVKARIRTHMKSVYHIRTIEKLGTMDALTETANRRAFFDHLDREWERAGKQKKTLGILLVDVDMLKQYNQTYGHLQGDVMLHALGRVFGRYSAAEGSLVARLESDEFAIILPETDAAGAMNVAESIRNDVYALEIPSIGAMKTQATVSIGVAATVPDESTSATDLLREAKERLREAKVMGGNKCV